MGEQVPAFTKKALKLVAEFQGLSLKSGGYLLSHLRSTIGAGGLNFSVRDGKRWDPAAITALNMFQVKSASPVRVTCMGRKANCKRIPTISAIVAMVAIPWRMAQRLLTAKALGQLVQLGYDVAAFTPAAYRRPRLGRPSMEI